MSTLLETAATHLRSEDWNFDSDLENSRLHGSANGDAATFTWFLSESIPPELLGPILDAAGGAVLARVKITDVAIQQGEIVGSLKLQ